MSHDHIASLTLITLEDGMRKFAMKPAVRPTLLCLSACVLTTLSAPSWASTQEAGPLPVSEGPGKAASDCRMLRACLHLSLQAAMREDIDTMHLLATVIDAMPKPPPGNKSASNRLRGEALASLQRGDTDQAQVQLRSALRENPRDVESAIHLGQALLQSSRPREAIETLTQALLIEPRHSGVWASMGEALALQGEAAEASAALWTAWLWSGHRARTLKAFEDKAQREARRRPAVAKVYTSTLHWIHEGQRPTFVATR